MSTAAATSPSATRASLAGSATFRAFAVVFAISTPVLYVICEMANWPLFTYHPGTNRVDLGWAPAVRDEGPAMHWYGWTANALIGSGLLAVIGAKAPQRLTAKVPLALVWLVPLAAVPVLVYTLRFFWRW